MQVRELADRVARAHARTGARVLIGIAGVPGAGKSTLAEALVAALAARPGWGADAVAHVPMDGFHLADGALDLLGLRERKGAPETFDAAGYVALLARVRSGEAVWAPAFERTLEQPIAQRLPVAATARVVVSEGNYLLLDTGDWPRARALFDEVWFCRMPEPARRDALLARHVRFGKTPAQAQEWIERVDEPNARLVLATAARADLLVDVDVGGDSDAGGGADAGPGD